MVNCTYTECIRALVHYHYYPGILSIIRKLSAQSRTQHAKHIFILTVSHNAKKKSKYHQQQKAIHKMHVNPGAYLSKRKVFFISVLIGSYATLLYANNDFICWIWLEKDHLYGFHSYLGTF